MHPPPNCFFFASDANDMKEENVLDVRNNDAVSAVGLFGAQPVKVLHLVSEQLHDREQSRPY